MLPDVPNRQQPTRLAHGDTVQTATATGAFITPQSLVTFPFAAGLVAGFWKGAQTLLPSWGSSPWVALVIAFGVGLLISLISLSDNRLQLSRSGKAIAVGVGFLNCFYLFLAALGMAPK